MSHSDLACTLLTDSIRAVRTAKDPTTDMEWLSTTGYEFYTLLGYTIAQTEWVEWVNNKCPTDNELIFHKR